MLLEANENGEILDFYIGKILAEDDISIDHVIPWSFMYSDDIWNLVITSKSENSKKSNHIPDDVVIERLIIRNDELLKHIKDDKYKDELRNAIQQDYVRNFYRVCKM